MSRGSTCSLPRISVFPACTPLSRGTIVSMRKTAVLLLALLLPVQIAVADVELSFGVYTTDKPTDAVKKFRPILKVLERDLTERLGEPVRIWIQVAFSYEKGIYDISEGRVDFARLGPASYVELKRLDPDSEILAMESRKGEKRFNGIICVAKDSPIEGVAELKGKTFAFANARSSIGRYLSQLYLLENGIHLSDLSRSRYLDRQENVGHAVATGRFDAGALEEGTFERLVQQGVRLRAIATFQNVTSPWLARSGLEPRILNALRNALLENKDFRALQVLGKDGFLPATDDDFQIVYRAVIKNTEFYSPPADPT